MKIPPQALLLSLLTLAGPVVGAAYVPEWLTDDRGLLLWLTPILPAFLLAYYRGWKGVAVMLALGMASITGANLVFAVSGGTPPSWPTMLTLVVVYLVLTNGVAALAELLHRERRAAERMAFVDPLTGLANRRYADTHLERVFASALRGESLALVMFDLDHFKRVNDRFGHAVGDEVIQSMGEVLKRNTRRMNLAARFGGEEFLVALSSITPEAALGYAERIRGEFCEADLPAGRVTVSAGVAMYAPGMGSADVLIAAADRALYQAKGRGRDRAVMATSEPTHKSEIRVGTPSGNDDGIATIAVVDDDPRVLVPLSRMLKQMGYRTWSAEGGLAALTLFGQAETPADVLLTDVVMPDMNGLVLVDELTKMGHHIPVIYMSGQIQARVTWPGISGEVAAFLQKPIEVSDLAASLTAALGLEPSEHDDPKDAHDLTVRSATSPDLPVALESDDLAACASADHREVR